MNQGIYGLFDPRRPWKIVYVGATSNLSHRRKAHRSYPRQSGDGPQAAWKQSLKDDGQKPGFVVLESGPYTKESEREWIQWAASFGPVLNVENRR